MGGVTSGGILYRWQDTLSSPMAQSITVELYSPAFPTASIPYSYLQATATCLNPLPKHPAASRYHHHKQQMTMLCEPSSQVYLSRPMTKSLPSLRPRAIACPPARPHPHLSSLNPPLGNAEISLSVNAGAQTEEGQEHWDTSSSQAQRSVMVAIDPIIENIPLPLLQPTTSVVALQ